MAYSCIVQCCGNNRSNVKISDEYISFFRLPDVDVMREGWLKRIGTVKMPANHQHARICSIHFTEQSFVNPASAEIQTATRNKRRRRLVPHAVPTLYLTEDSNSRVREQLDFKIIRKEFVLRTQSSVSKKKPPDAEEISCEQDKLNVSASNQSPEIVSLFTTPTLREKLSDQFAENMIPKSLYNTTECSTRYQVDDTPIDENTKHDVRAVATFPRSCSYTVKEEKRESVGEEGSPAWKRTKQFITEHLVERKTANEAKPTEEDPETRIKSPIEQINYLQTLVQFYKNSKTKDEGEIEQLRAQCAAYALDLKKEQDEKNKLFVEISELQKLNEKLYTKLGSAEIEQNACKQQQKSILHSILQS
ncbi:uncharacterized protein LOC124406365 [Diprion similis]|uniref:uncharacterized protein LOC124406365 n=1 Tax=Diprion similis TaxID=362088 RepID=UPI001EF76DEA|nr:uncharacterized protein LOC124406365 [Diprion similis]